MKPIKLIKASAGSGKTYALMECLSTSIVTGTEPEGLFASTFTVKAAAELQARIRQRLLEEGKPELAARVFDGLIGTVNGVCGQLLSEYAIDAGLSPAQDVLSAENADAIFNVAADSVIKSYLNLEEVAAHLWLSPIKEDKHRKTADWKKDVKTVLDFARSNGLGKAELEKCAELSCERLREVFSGTVDFSLEAIKKLVKQPSLRQGKFDGKTTKTLDAFKDFCRFPNWYIASRIGNCDVNADGKDLQEYIDEVKGKLLDSKQLYEDMCAMIRGVFACAGESLKVYSQYKENFGLVDFVDQECKVLEQANTNGHFGALLKQRLTQIMVDEFQDTSPIQLALFLKLNEFTEKGSIWVGDPKQAIYGFRGTDPELLEAVAGIIPDSRSLPYSWRSKANLVNLSNEIFRTAFPAMKPKEVELGIPDARREKASGGVIEAWHLKATNVESRMKALAQGVATLIREGIAPGDIAVLFRSNDDCKALATALEERHITASTPSGSLLKTPECQLVMAAYRYCINRDDTVALATLLALYGETPDWLKRLQAAKAEYLAIPEADRKGVDWLSDIRELNFLKKLLRTFDETPLEILERVITLLNLDEKTAALPSPGRRLGNIDELRRLCCEYMNQALANRSAATPAGFVAMLNTSTAPQAAGSGRDTVNVLTYHSAKGLEWPVVILAPLPEKKASLFEVRVNQAERFDVDKPLKDRTIHYWPWPFGLTKEIDELNNILQNHPLHEMVTTRMVEEEKRLFYVGFTRARDRVIFALERKATTDMLQFDWLDRLTKPSFFHFPQEAGKSMRAGKREFPLTTRILSPEGETSPPVMPTVFQDSLPAEAAAHAPAHLSPSGQPKENGTAELLCEWPLKPDRPTGKDEYDSIGNAFHSFIALPPEYRREEIAKAILANWELTDRVTPAALMRAAENLSGWINETYPQTQVNCEVPMTFRDENGTLYQGFIDMLIETQDGYVIIDHKTGIWSDSKFYAAGHAAQLRLYRQAVEKATGKPVTATIIHLPLTAQLFKVNQQNMETVWLA